MRGFTLVEFSMILTIIGLIIGGVLVGQELIHISKLRATLGQLKEFRAANNTFVVKYKYYPGDLPGNKAEIYQLSEGPCDDITTPGCAGNGDGYYDGATDELGCIFYHLSKARMISANITEMAKLSFIMPGRTLVYSGSRPFSLTYPRSKLELALLWITIDWDAAVLFYPINRVGLSLGFDPDAWDDNRGSGVDLLSAFDSHWMDSKADDGLAGTGLVQYWNTHGFSTEPCLDSNGNYDVTRGSDQICSIKMRWHN